MRLARRCRQRSRLRRAGRRGRLVQLAADRPDGVAAGVSDAGGDEAQASGRCQRIRRAQGRPVECRVRRAVDRSDESEAGRGHRPTNGCPTVTHSCLMQRLVPLLQWVSPTVGLPCFCPAGDVAVQPGPIRHDGPLGRCRLDRLERRHLIALGCRISNGWKQSSPRSRPTRPVCPAAPRQRAGSSHTFNGGMWTAATGEGLTISRTHRRTVRRRRTRCPQGPP